MKRLSRHSTPVKPKKTIVATCDSDCALAARDHLRRALDSILRITDARNRSLLVEMLPAIQWQIEQLRAVAEPKEGDAK